MAGLPFNESSEIPFNDPMKPISNGHRLHAAGSIPFGTEEVQSVFVLRLGGTQVFLGSIFGLTCRDLNVAWSKLVRCGPEMTNELGIS